ncbi:MAG: TVP38/TMEM64 family protein [Cyanobacteria bacterium SBLK]|nr:TVP38/TMEM64 family protein [Cyanobacteria bacterium SBLK]
MRRKFSFLSSFPIRKLCRFGFFALGICLFLCSIDSLKTILVDREFWLNKLHDFGDWAVFAFIGAYVILTVLGIPGTILTVTGGLVFGLIWGTIWSVVGATLGAIAAFCAARYCLRNWAKNKFQQHHCLKYFEETVAKMPLNFVLAVRFAPISPFNVVNFLFGLTPIDLKTYSVGTFFGIIPGTLAYTWLGVTGKTALESGEYIPFCIALGILTILSLLPLLTKTKVMSKTNLQPRPTPQSPTHPLTSSQEGESKRGRVRENLNK